MRLLCWISLVNDQAYISSNILIRGSFVKYLQLFFARVASELLYEAFQDLVTAVELIL